MAYLYFFLTKGNLLDQFDPCSFVGLWITTISRLKDSLIFRTDHSESELIKGLEERNSITWFSSVSVEPMACRLRLAEDYSVM